MLWSREHRLLVTASLFCGAGEGTHSVAHGGAVLPDTLRWIWSGDDGKGNATGSVRATVAVVRFANNIIAIATACSPETQHSQSTILGHHHELLTVPAMCIEIR